MSLFHFLQRALLLLLDNRAVLGRTTLQTKSKGSATAYLQHNLGGAEEGTAPRFKGRSGAWFLYASLTFGSRFSLQDLGMRENMDV